MRGEIRLRIFLPIECPETVVVKALGRTWELHSDDGWFSLPPTLHPRDSFSLYREGTILCETAIQTLSNLDAVATVLSCETSMGHIDHVPINRTRIFYADDQEVTLVFQMEGVQSDLPATLSWYFEGKFQFGLWSVIPKCHGTDGVRTFVHGMNLAADTLKGHWYVSLRLLTGKELYRSEVRIMDRRRGSYGAPLGGLR